MRPCPYPVGHLLNPATKYVPACATDIRETFKRIRARRPDHRSQMIARWELRFASSFVVSDGRFSWLQLPTLRARVAE
jgi:hypothetical protein